MTEYTTTTEPWDGRERRSADRLDDEVRAKRLLTKYRAGGREAASARDALIMQFKPLVQKQARLFLTSNVPFDDLVQEGFLGLMHGIDQYDPTRGVKLITYATHHIDGHLRHYLRDRVQIIKEPAWLQEVALKVRRETESLTQDYGREPTDNEVARSLGLTEREVSRIKATRSVFTVTSLDEAQETGGPAAHVVEGQSSTELPIEDKVVLETAILRLKEIERKVLFSYYYEDRSQTEIAQQLGVSNNYISHILKNSARKLQQMFRSDAVREAALEHERRRIRLAKSGPDTLENDEAPSTIVEPITSLFTGKYFDERLAEELSRAKRHELEMSVIRLQVSKELTDPVLFNQIAGVLRDCTRRSDIVARTGIDELSALLPHTGAGRHVVCDRLMNNLVTLQSSFDLPGRVLVGSASYPDNMHKDELLTAATPINETHVKAATYA